MRGIVSMTVAAALLLASGHALAENETVSQQVPAESEQSQPQEQKTSEPVKMVRTLQLMQDQIAAGSTEAHLGQRGLLTILDERFMALDPETWRDRKNTNAAVTFVLSGGSPQVLRKILGLGTSFVPQEDIPFIEGALAYVEGREEEAKKALLSIDVRTLPAYQGAQIALVQSALMVRTDVPKSDELLDFVRLQAPGTLLEEAALRRQVFVASQAHNLKKFQLLATEYLTRYRHSIYAGNFRQRLASALTRIDFAKEISHFDGFVAMMSELEPTARRELYLMAAQSSLEQGFSKSASLMADKAAEVADADQASTQRIALYQAAAVITSPDKIDIATQKLQSINRSLLTSRDITLLDAALSMAGQIRRLPGAASVKNSEPQPVRVEAANAPSGQAIVTQAPEQLPALSKAREALSRIDKLIKQ